MTLSMDNVTAVSQINRKSSPTSELLLELSKVILEFCLVRGITLTAVYLPGRLDKTADFLSREWQDSSDWKLNKKVFFPTSRESEGNGGRSVCNPYEHSITQVCQLGGGEGRSGGHGNGQPAVMLVGHQEICVPTILLDRESVTQNLEGGGDNRPYYPDMAGANVVSDVAVFVRNPILLPQMRRLLLNQQGAEHPLSQQEFLRLAAWTVSGKEWLRTDFLKNQPIYSWTSGEMAQKGLMRRPGASGLAGLVAGKLIRFRPL